MKQVILFTLLALPFFCLPAFSLEKDERALHADGEMLKIIDRLTPEQQKKVIELVEADEFERYAKELEDREQ